MGLLQNTVPTNQHELKYEFNKNYRRAICENLLNISDYSCRFVVLQQCHNIKKDRLKRRQKPVKSIQKHLISILLPNLLMNFCIKTKN